MTDVRRQITAVSRSLTRGEKVVATISQTYDTGLEDLWDAVTNLERIPRWFMPITGDLREGGTYQLTGNAHGSIIKCDRPNGFYATWEYGPEVSWIEVRLTAEGPDRARLQLRHTASVAQELWDQFGPGAVGIGWDSGLLGLALHLSGEAGPSPEEAAAWVATDEGREFMRLSSDAWYDANVASGEDPARALGMADRSYGAYTG